MLNVPRQGCFGPARVHLRGRVVDAAGARCCNPRHFTDSRQGHSSGWRQTGFTTTRVDGSYQIDLIALGDYVVVANQGGSTSRRPYPARYYPQAVSAEDARTVHIGTAQDLSGVDISMPMAMRTVPVPLQIVMQDGRPATLAITVSGHVAATPYSVEPMSADTDREGHAMLLLYEGEEYDITALDSSEAGQRCGGPLRLEAKAGLGTQTIRIEHPWGNCLAQLSPNFQPPR